MTATIADRARELTDSRRPYVHATVVRAQEPTSARPGDDALILADGSIEGFVGGVCAESSVRMAALDTLRDGNSLLLRVLPDSAADFPETPGALVVVNPCHSGGAIEIFLRPYLPRPLLGVTGNTPIARAIADLAAFCDFEITPAGSYAGATAVVVAGLGRNEEHQIRAALDAGVGLIALISSHRRGEALLDGMSLTDEERVRIRPHAGLDIGAHTPKEIALSVLAEIVQAIRVEGLTAPKQAATPHPQPSTAPQQVVAPPGATLLKLADSSATASLPTGSHPTASLPTVSLPTGSLPAASLPGSLPSTDLSATDLLAATEPRRAIDPICGMTVLVGPDTPHAEADGEDYWFCCPGCRRAFLKA